MSLSSLVFSDLFVPGDIAESWYKQTPDSMVVNEVPTEMAEEIHVLRLELQKQRAGRQSFRVTWGQPEKFDMRVGYMKTAAGADVFICRRFMIPATDLQSLGVPDRIASGLLAPELKEGLVVYMGTTGSGKTTAASATVIQRLTMHGGVCWTVESPVEMPLHGRHGKGWCYQTEVDDEAKIGGAIRDMMRATPNIIFIGELRDGSAVREAIKASLSGHLVIATFHAGDLISGISRLALLAEDDSASMALSDALKVAVHLSLYTDEPGKAPPVSMAFIGRPKGTGKPPRVLCTTPIFLNGPDTDGLRSHIKKKEFALLNSEVQRQQRSMMMNRLNDRGVSP